jgi:hypothetical protein
MRKMRIVLRGGCFIASVFLLFVILFSVKDVFSTDYTTANTGSAPAADHAMYYTGAKTYSTGDTITGNFCCPAGVTFSGVLTLSMNGMIGTEFYFSNESVASNLTLGNNLVFGPCNSDPYFSVLSALSTDTYSISIDGAGYTIFLDSDLTFNDNNSKQIFSIVGNLTIDGRGHAITFDTRTSFSIVDAKTLTFKNAIIRGLTRKATQNFWALGSSSKVVFQNVIIDLTGDWTFSDWHETNGCKLDILDTVIVKGGCAFGYESKGALTIGADNHYGTLMFDHDMTFTWNPPAASNTFTMSNRNSWLYLDGCTLNVPKNRCLNLTKGTLLFDNKVVVNNNNNSTDDDTHGIKLGSGASGYDVEVKVLSGARVEVSGLIRHYPSTD